jgi:hypothetical protein
MNLPRSENYISGSTVHMLSVDVLFVHHETSVIAAFSFCVIEKDVKVNIIYAAIRTLCSIEFQGPCSRDLNLGQPENCISGMYGP